MRKREVKTGRFVRVNDKILTASAKMAFWTEAEGIWYVRRCNHVGRICKPKPYKDEEDMGCFASAESYFKETGEVPVRFPKSKKIYYFFPSELNTVQCASGTLDTLERCPPMLEVLNDYDWGMAFEYAGDRSSAYLGGRVYGTPWLSGAIPGRTYNLSHFCREDVTRIIGISEGKNDERPWLIAGKLRDGRWFYLEAGCDYTGWDCQAGGQAVIAKSKKELIQFGIPSESCRRLSLAFEGEE